ICRANCTRSPVPRSENNHVSRLLSEIPWRAHRLRPIAGWCYSAGPSPRGLRPLVLLVLAGLRAKLLFANPLRAQFAHEEILPTHPAGLPAAKSVALLELD